MKLLSIAASLALVLLCAGCATSVDQMEQVQKTVSHTTRENLYLVVNMPLDNTDDLDDPAQGIAFPIGTYKLEAEDLDYWYFRAPKPITMAVYEFGKQLNGMRIYGGIALSKTGDNATPAPHAYVDDKAKSGKILIWKMSPDFLSKRGQKWFLSTDKKTVTGDATSATPAPAK